MLLEIGREPTPEELAEKLVMPVREGAQIADDRQGAHQPPRITVAPKLGGAPSFGFLSQDPFDSGELADHTANSPQAVRIGATLVVLDLDQCEDSAARFALASRRLGREPF